VSFISISSFQVDAVIFCLFTSKDIEAYHKILPAYFPLCSKVAAKDESKNGVDDNVDVAEKKVDDSAEDQNNEGGAVTKADAASDEANAEDGSEDDEDSTNGAKCIDSKDKVTEKQSHSTKQHNSEPMSQEQSNSMNQEKSDSMSQEESATANLDEKEEPMSYQQEG
jgi:hypothetical protein